MILDSGKTRLISTDEYGEFESVVILDSGKTDEFGEYSPVMFESVVILDRFSKKGGRTFGGFCLLSSACQGSIAS